MRAFELLAALIAALSANEVTAVSLKPRSSSPRVIGLPIQKRSVNPLNHDRNRRTKRQTVTEVLDNEETLYFANITLGTPAQVSNHSIPGCSQSLESTRLDCLTDYRQTLQMHIDTGSSDLWVNDASSSLCQSSGDVCIGGTYDSSSSSTYKLLNDDFNISYVDGSSATGNYVTDTLSIGGQTLQDFQFGVGIQSTSDEGVLGIGYTSNEIQVNRLGQTAYPNLPAAMVDAKLIQSNAYSLWLNDLDASQGQILFGGVNTEKYTGSLQTIPIIKEDGNYYEFIIALTGLSIGSTEPSSTTTSSSLPAPVLLDSGSSLVYLPDDLTTDVYNTVSAVYDSSAGAAYVDCSLANNDSSIQFTFSGATISVPYNELVLDAGTNSAGQPLTFSDGTPACIFGIAPAGTSTPVLGDTFLRSAYVVYDLANNEISLAQTNFNSTSDNIQEIGASGTIPDATAVASPVTTVVAGTGGARLGGPSGTNPTAVSGSIPTQIPVAMAALGVVGGIFMAAL